MKGSFCLGSVLALALAALACNALTRHRLVSTEYGFSVEFPEKPVEQSSANYQGLPKKLWTVERDKSKEFFSAEATSYKDEINPARNWVPAQELLGMVEIQVTDVNRYYMRAASTGREVQAIATTAKQIATGATLSSIYLVDGRTLISVTARTTDEHRRTAFLNSLSLLR